MENETFRFLVMNQNGKRIETDIAARSEQDAEFILRRKGLIPLKSVQKEYRNVSHSGFSFHLRKKFDVMSFINRLAPLLAANVPLENALAVMESGSQNEENTRVLKELRAQLHEGESFSALIQKNSRYFPPIVAGLVRTGEEAGCLPSVMNDLRNFLHEQREFRNFIITSSIYPVIVASVTIGVVLLLFTVFIPKFAQVFEDMHAELPGLTKLMLNISHFITGNLFLLPILIAGIFLLYRQMRKPGLVRNFKDGLMLKIPVVRDLAVSVQISSFLQAMTIMMKSHVEILSALNISLDLIENTQIRKEFESVVPQIQSGKKMSEVLGNVRYLPEGTASMLKVAEESGEIGEMFGRLFMEEQEETRLKFKRLLAMMEPLFIMLLALMVMTVVLAVFLAVWKMNSIGR